MVKNWKRMRKTENERTIWKLQAIYRLESVPQCRAGKFRSHSSQIRNQKSQYATHGWVAIRGTAHSLENERRTTVRSRLSRPRAVTLSRRSFNPPQYVSRPRVFNFQPSSVIGAHIMFSKWCKVKRKREFIKVRLRARASDYEELWLGRAKGSHNRTLLEIGKISRPSTHKYSFTEQY